MSESSHPYQRALALNLDPSVYGSFAEIGAGQEVAGWFFRVGGAAGTVARTISAYDMAVSDGLYGQCDRYVSRERLLAMLATELDLLVTQLDEARGTKTRFFAFADTVSARNYAGTNECHGWVGIAFQAEPRQAPSRILLHVNLRDGTNLLQQEALGMLGVHVVHTAFRARQSLGDLLGSLSAGLPRDRIEIDWIELSGPAFPWFDAHEAGIELVTRGLAALTLLSADRGLETPSEALRKRAIVLERGAHLDRDRTPLDTLAAAEAQLKAELPAEARAPVALFELPVPENEPTDTQAGANLRRRVASLLASGRPVALTSFPQAWRLTGFLRRYTQEPVRFVMPLPALIETVVGPRGPHALGEALRALGNLLEADARFYVRSAPAASVRDALQRTGADPSPLDASGASDVGADEVQLPLPVRHLYAYLLASGWIVPLSMPRS